MTDLQWTAMITVGRVVRPHGNRGQVVVAPETDFGRERFGVGATLYLERGGKVEPAQVTSARERHGRWIVGFDGVMTIADAEALRGLELRIPPGQLRALGPGAYYVHDLVGARVETSAGARVGTVTRVDFGAGTPLLAVAGSSGEQLVPLAEDICKRVDITAGVVVIDPPGGLLELNAPGRTRGRGRDRTKRRTGRTERPRVASRTGGHRDA